MTKGGLAAPIARSPARPQSPHRDSAPELPRPPDLAIPHDPFDGLEVVDAFQRILAHENEVRVVTRHDGADLAARRAPMARAASRVAVSRAAVGDRPIESTYRRSSSSREARS